MFFLSSSSSYYEKNKSYDKVTEVQMSLVCEWVYCLHCFLSGVSNSVESHPLQLDTVSSSGSLHSLSAVNTALKKGARDPECVAGASGSHGSCLTLNDHDRIRQFIQEFTFRGLLPHIEKNIRQLNDQVPLQVVALDILKHCDKWVQWINKASTMLYLKNLFP